MKKSILLLFCILFQMQATFAQWQALNGPYGDNTGKPVFFNSIAYAGSYQGLISSTDGGTTWSEANVSFYDRYMSLVYFNEGKLIYNRTYYSYGWISLDSGSTWTQMTTLGQYDPYQYLVSNGVIYAICAYEITQKSYDNGITWVPFSHPPSSNTRNDISEDNGRLYWTTSSNGSGISDMFYSDDEGMTWLTLPTNGISSNASFYQIIANGNQLFVSSTGGLFKSIDGGANWTIFAAGLPLSYAYFYHYTRIYSAGEKLYAYVHNDGGIFESDTSTANFINISAGLPFEMYASSITENGNKLYCSSPSGLFSTDKTNINWQLSEEGVLMHSCSAIGALDSTLLIGNNYSVHVSHDLGDSFSSVPVGEATSKIYVRDSIIYAVSARGYKSSDGGYTWTDLNFPYGWFGQNLIDFCVLNNYYFGLNASDRVVKYSNDNGATWTNLTGLPANNVNCIVTSNSKLFAGTNNGIYRSSNNGTSWSTILSGNNFNFLIFENGNLYASSYNDIWVSMDDGVTWQDMNFPGLNVVAVTVKNNKVVVAPGLYYTSDFGVNWSTQPAPGLVGYTTELLLTDSWLYAAHNDTIFKLSSSVLTSLEPQSTLQSSIKISPNPFSDLITITIPTEETGSIDKVKILDITGRIQVPQNINANNAGHLELNLSNLKSGLYFVELELRNKLIVSKIIKY